MASGAYVLGTEPPERERLRLQHEVWLPLAQAAWERAQLAPGQRVLDLGAGPGFCSVELARAVGAKGRVLALEHSDTYVEHARAAGAAANLAQLEVRHHDLAGDGPLDWGREAGSFDLAWCRWLAMFLSRLDPFVALLGQGLKPGGRFVAHEYMHWGTFALHPYGEAVARFGRAVRASFREAGGDEDVNRRLPALLVSRGFRIDDLRPLPVLGRGGDGWSQWMERFVSLYGEELIRQGRWSEADAEEAAAEMAAARSDPGSYWVGPTVLELRATRVGS
ncbi:methyltransferase domain-containing protein [Synechococcus sp. CS-1328]|uniref:methyltransferase domain-containing protein n=1 Tax=Synechococcus sp. CS-1328 TaxID=2847976 RepID=UPI00223AB7FB|nr:methyltransferase domain-containing protein [Synechococcus sp. CS-1328]MCT0223739.1 methyltransferase domain-containing protein [Synechococcus sp. CS-1328]